MHSKATQHGSWRLDTSGLVHEDKEGVLKICSLCGQGVDWRCFPLGFPKIFATLGILSRDEGGHS